MPNTSARKAALEKEHAAAAATLQCPQSISGSAAADSVLNTSSGSNSSGKSRKRKHCEIVTFSDFESEFENCDLDDAVALETKLRKVARRNSLTHEEMMKLLQKFVKNEHVLALVTLKAENELAREKAMTEDRAIIITDTPSVPKLTRAKAKELNKTPFSNLAHLRETETPEIAKLIKEDLISDDEDEEYTFKEEDFVSDDDPNTTASDVESNPRTPAVDTEIDSPVKLTEDGCFKVPLNKKDHPTEELRIATRTRSKLCLQQTTIEDLQSEFQPPDIEELSEGIESEVQGFDEDWMQFLTDFTKPLSTSFVGDDDDPINDPEYVAAEKEPVDAEELRDVNISKKEVAELMKELFNESFDNICFDSIDLEIPSKVIQSSQEENLVTPNSSPERIQRKTDLTQHVDFIQQPEPATLPQSSAVTSSNVTQQDMSFHPDVMSTPSSHSNAKRVDCEENDALIPVANVIQNTVCSPGSKVTIPGTNLNSEVEFIALPIPGQPNHYQLAKIVSSDDNIQQTNHTQSLQVPIESSVKELDPKPDVRYDGPYDANYAGVYISLKRHAYSEFKEKFDESLKHAQVNQISSTTCDAELDDENRSGFTRYQYDLLQQQMRIHVQMLTQTYIQTYCHPILWKLAKKPKEMLMELKTKAQTNNNFKVWNLESAIKLTECWQQELDEDTEANKELMEFIHTEIDRTKYNSRQVPKFHPRMLECFLESNVFMYPEYLPRMPFTAKVIQFEIFSPVEMYLIAMGLEKHTKAIIENKERISTKSTPLRTACHRLVKDTIRGKSSRIVWNYIQRCKNADFYNPIKYYFDNDKAPPVEYTPIIGFENNIVPPPKDRVDELPLVFKTYLQMKNAPPKEKKRRKRPPSKRRIKVSDNFRNSYLEFVREALGEDIALPDSCEEATQPDASVSLEQNNINQPEAESKSKTPVQRSRSKCKVAENLTINVNYVFGAGATSTSCGAPTAPSTPNLNNPPLLSANSIDSGVSLNTIDKTNLASAPKEVGEDTSFNPSINTSLSLPGSTISQPTISQPSEDLPIITYNFNLATQTLESCTQTASSDAQRLTNQTEITEPNNDQGNNPLSFTPQPAKHQTNQIQNDKLVNSIKIASWKKKKTRKKTKILSKVYKFHTKTKRKAVAYREKRQIKQRCEDLITAYGLYLEALQLRFQNVPIVQQYYRKFKALELYTNLLRSLKRICNKKSLLEKESYEAIMSNSTTSSSPSGVKRSRNSNAEDESSPSSQRMARKINRQEENFRQMLLPDTPEEVNRKDAIYAFNFYEKVEEAFRTSNRPDDCKKFNAILKSFDPNCDKVSELYHKLEKLFLPDHPELAQVFLTFILPSDAAQIGKFFEHFMINHMATFINKLNIYFNKQPAQVRKIYNCLNELAEDPGVSIKKLEAKIVPLLKGNQFLTDWFMQQFPQTVPPERLFGIPENIQNMKEQESNRTGEYVETIADLLESSPNENQAQQTCQLRYINGRIFYGSKMLLPAKLSFMASAFKETPETTQVTFPIKPSAPCVHAVKDHGEKRLQAASELATVTTTTEWYDDQDKSEEDDLSKQLVIDTTAEEDDSCSSIEACDENTLKSHAMRLNPSYYSSACYSSNATSTPNTNSNFQSHQSHAKKTSLNFNEAENAGNAGKTSPRKCLSQAANISPLAGSNLPSINTKEKRKSPCKKTRSPLNNSAARSSVRSCNQPMVVIYETSSAIQCAKRLKSLVESAESSEETLDIKEHINIIARTKSSMKTTAGSNLDSIKVDDGVSIKKLESVKQVTNDDLEFLPEEQHSSVTRSPFPSLNVETDSNEEDIAVSKAITVKDARSQSNKEPPPSTNSTDGTNGAWTRDEDKTILIEMKLDSKNKEELFHRIAEKLTQRTMTEIMDRHKFLVEFLSKLQKK